MTVGTREAQVWYGTADRTSGGLKKIRFSYEKWSY